MSMQSENHDEPGKPAAPTLTSLDDLKGQASQAVQDAKGSLSTIASDARGKLNDIVDQQKQTGAGHLSGLAHAAQTAAGDLDGSNPQVARLIRDAASTVDRFAGDLRERNLGDVVASVAGFARQQPVAFFAGSVLMGFVLARFLKSEARYADE